MLSIRLKRMGRIHKPFYRIVVSENSNRPTGASVEEVGHYDPLKPEDLLINLERVDYWISKGARPSGTVKSLIKRARSVKVSTES